MLFDANATLRCLFVLELILLFFVNLSRQNVNSFETGRRGNDDGGGRKFLGHTRYHKFQNFIMA